MKYVTIRRKFIRPGATEPDAEWTLLFYENDKLYDAQAWPTIAKARSGLRTEGYWQRVEWSRIFDGESHTVYFVNEANRLRATLEQVSK